MQDLFLDNLHSALYALYENIVVHVCVHFMTTPYPPDNVALFSPFCTTASWTTSEEEKKTFIYCIYFKCAVKKKINKSGITT